MNLELGYVTDRGLNPRRTRNEDNLLVLPERGLFLVADGVGGRRGGETASRTVVEVFRRVFSQPRFIDDHRAVLLSTIDLCNQKIYEGAQSNIDLEGMATTVAAVAVSGNIATVVHVGDSRVYRIDSQGLVRLTEDHSEVGEALRAGRITEELAATHPKRNVINRALGADSEVEPDLIEIELDETTTLLLCTDGVTRYLDDAQLEELLLSGRHPQTLCQMIRERCYDGGADDNLTAIVVDFGERSYQEHQAAPPLPTEAMVPAGFIDVDPTGERWDSGEDGADLVAEAGRLAPGAGRDEDRFDLELAAEGDDEEGEPFDEMMADGDEPEEPEEPEGQVVDGELVAREGILAGLRWSLLVVGLAVGTVFGWLVGPPVMARFGELFGERTIYDVKGIEHPPRHPEVNSAYALHLEQQSELARQRLEELLRTAPGNAEACLFLGIIEYDLENYDRSVNLFQRAAKIDPSLTNVRVRMALSYSRMGQSRNAADVLQELVGKRNSPRGQSPSPEAPPTGQPAPPGGRDEGATAVKPVG
ncbi:MAG: hypothetical protein RIR52_548 [Acidobacteriota bacterium]